MSFPVFLAVIGAAFLHALWNALIKTGADKLAGMLLMTVVQGGFGLLLALGRDFPAGQVWLWLLASGGFHTVYKLFLAYAYQHGDLSRVYPIARGAAPLIVLGIGFVFLSDVVSAPEYAGIIVLGLGILLMGRGVFAAREPARLVPLALGSAMATAGYSIVDGMGARISGDAVTYVAWLFVMDAAFFLPVTVMLRGRAILVQSPRIWRLNAVAALASYGAYAIAVWAMTQAPIALVTATRETSILFAVLIGWILFRDRMGGQKILAAALIVGGVILTRI